MRALTPAIAAAVLVVSHPSPAHAHPGGLDASGCHTNRKTGEYHCHRAANRPAPAPSPRRNGSAGTYYPNCAAARAAGAAPLRRGDPGYRAGLDRDDDGIACE
ncbi:excalibur calcium-binding domain-containing protein [Altererythrobacter fulvus]|uniref:excalibur calcium-binding domain-containing protein n=1 Tax=Caenibius fulvus TaxID=2126012 RepID=UPI0030198DC8